MAVEERLAMSKNSSTTSKPTVNALMNMTSLAVTYVCAVIKARLKAAHNFNLSLKATIILSERSFVQREIVERKKLVYFIKCFFSGHEYSVNIVKQFFMNSPSPRGFPFPP